MISTGPPPMILVLISLARTEIAIFKFPKIHSHSNLPQVKLKRAIKIFLLNHMFLATLDTVLTMVGSVPAFILHYVYFVVRFSIQTD